MRNDVAWILGLLEHQEHSVSVENHKRRRLSPKTLVFKTHRVAIVVRGCHYISYEKDCSASREFWGCAHCRDAERWRSAVRACARLLQRVAGPDCHYRRELSSLCVQTKAKRFGNFKNGGKAWVAGLVNALYRLSRLSQCRATCDMPFARAMSPSARAIPAASSGASASHASRYAAISSGVRNCSATSYATVLVFALDLDVVLRMTVTLIDCEQGQRRL